MKTYQFYKASAFVFLFGFMLTLISCDKNSENVKRPTIKEIVENPESYYGKTVNLEGQYGGWSDNALCDYESIVMKTRNDVYIYDETGCIYLTGSYEILFNEMELNPTDTSCIGSNIEIEALVSQFDGKPILGDF